MKVRSSFVTNSSSSSYIIAYRTPFDGTQKMIDAIINATDYDDTRKAKIIANKEEWDKFFIDENGWLGKTLEDIFASDEDGIKEQYDNVMQYFNNGYKIMEKRISDHAEGFYSFLRKLSTDNDDFVIVSGG